jgi:CHAD domain-containing protein
LSIKGLIADHKRLNAKGPLCDPSVTNRTMPAAMPIYSQAPTYLQDIAWLDFELKRAQDLAHTLKIQLKRLNRKCSVSRVHDARVALRRWNSVWDVMEADGWQSRKFKSTVSKQLKKLLKVLGDLRDCDVCLELGSEYTISAKLSARWQKKRRLAKRDVDSQLCKMDLTNLEAQINQYLLKRFSKLKKQLHQTSWIYLSAYDHLIVHLLQREQTAQLLESTAKSSKELHQLRLSIKAWRYFLSEFFGLTNLELVKSQQYLGKIHDLDRMEDLMAGYSEWPALTKMHAEKKRLTQKFEKIRHNLPYGLKPQEISLIS